MPSPHRHRGPRAGSSTFIGLALTLVASGACLDDPLAALGGRVDGLLCAEDTGFPLPSTGLTLGGQQGKTDRDGEFSFENVPPGSTELVVNGARRDRTLNVEVLAYGKTTVFVDDACRGMPGGPGTGGIRGQVCNRHIGQVLRDANVQVIAAGEEILASTTTDDNGLFAFDALAAQDVLLKISAPGFSRVLALTIEEGEVTEVDLGQCLLPELSQGFLVGSLCDPVAGGPLVGAYVSAVDADGAEATDLTDTDGSFLVGPLAGGDAIVSIAGPGVSLSYQARVIGGQDVVVVEELECPSDPEDPIDGTATVRGRVCAPGADHDTWLTGAVVTVDLPNGDTLTTTTDGQGRWTLTGLPPGEHVVHIQAGSFSDTLTVTLEDGETLLIPDGECAIDLLGARIAVIDGDWDDVGSVLTHVGVDPTMVTEFGRYEWPESLFADYETLASYDIVFINCGTDESDYLATPAMQENLRQYVQNGGSVYASDWAYDIIEASFPDYIDFVGEDLYPQSAETGSEGVYAATVEDPELLGALSTSAISLNYPLGSWAMIEAVSPSVRVFIRGEANSYETYYPSIPHTVSFAVGEGKVVYSSFHQEPGVNLQQEQVLRLLMFQL